MSPSPMTDDVLELYVYQFIFSTIFYFVLASARTLRFSQGKRQQPRGISPQKRRSKDQECAKYQTGYFIMLHRLVVSSEHILENQPVEILAVASIHSPARPPQIISATMTGCHARYYIHRKTLRLYKIAMAPPKTARTAA